MKAIRMTTLASLVLIVALACQQAPSPAETPTASRGSLVGYPSGNESVQAYLARPEGAGPFPAVILVHEWWGLNDWIQSNADELAQRGYVALAVDLYRGQVTSDPKLAHELSRGLPTDRAMADLEAAVAFLKSRPEVRPDRLGCIGWCMGGGYALELALRAPLQACVVAYGRVPTRPDSLKTLAGPVLGIFGEQDRGIPPETVRAFKTGLQETGKPHEVLLLPGVGHAFMNPNNREGYDRAAADQAWQAIYRFLERELKP
ncbi:MAG: dienelactone hydrolase family protein [Candidatus Eremiobacterota bacterium]